MLISHRHKFIYLKTTKTASTSVEVALEHLALPTNFARPKGSRQEAVVTEDGIVGARGRNANQHQWYNHMSALKVKSQIGEDIWKNYFKFCNIRNPWDKTVSAFHHAHPEIKSENRETIFKTFNSWVLKGDKLNPNRGTYCINNKPVVDDVIRYETLLPDINRICGIFGVPTVDLPNLKSEKRGEDKIDFHEYYDEKSKQIVEALYDIEIRQYGYSFE